MASHSLFMKIDGVTGSSGDGDYISWIGIDSVNQGIFSSVSAPGNGTNEFRKGAVTFEDVSIGKMLDSTSLQLSLMVCKGDLIKDITIVSMAELDGKNVEKVRWVYKECYLNKYFVSAVNGENSPVEHFSFIFSSAECTTNTLGTDGKVEKKGPGGWNLITNKKL